MRETTMSFFKTAKSTQVNSNDNQSSQHRTTSGFFQAWGESRPYGAPAGGQPVKPQSRGSDLGAQTEHVMAGGSLSILRRKGKAFKVVGKARAEDQQYAPAGQADCRLLGGDILSLVKELHEEAKHFKSVSHALLPTTLDNSTVSTL